MSAQNALSDAVERLLAQPGGRGLVLRPARTGQIIYAGDEDCDGELMIVRSGRLRSFVSFEGKELTLAVLEAGDAMHLHGGAMLEVKKEGEIALLSAEALRHAATADPALALAVIPALDRLLQKSIRMIEDMAFLGVKHRLIRVLCDTADREGRRAAGGIVLDRPPNAEDFAMQIGATRQSVSTVIAELVRSGILCRFGTGSLIIADLGRLRQELSGAR